MSASSKEEDFRRKAEIGYGRMRACRAAICSIVRDCERGLRTNIPAIHRLKECFREARVVIVENDSKDGTKGLLREWEKATPGVHVLSEDLGVQTIVDVGGGVNPGYTCHRVGRMAGYRNKYLEFIEGMKWEPDCVVMADLDLAWISLDGIANTFGQSVPWDAVTSNGWKASRRIYKYYDTFAFREEGDESPLTEERMGTHQNLLTGLAVGMPMLRVQSAFNGLAVYAADAIRGLRYRCEPNGDPRVEAVCEHVTFHRDMRKRGRGRIYINPSQIVVYKFRRPGLAASLGRLLARPFSRRRGDARPGAGGRGSPASGYPPR